MGEDTVHNETLQESIFEIQKDIEGGFYCEFIEQLEEDEAKSFSKQFESERSSQKDPR